MIKYVELTAPEASAYRQAKILTFEKAEGDYVKTGDTLFMVQSGNTKLELPSTKEGKIVEFIVSQNENINLATALLLLETEVESSTASLPIESKDSEPKTKKKDNTSAAKKHEQQALDLSATSGADEKSETNISNENSTEKPPINTNVIEKKPMPEKNLLTITVPDIGADSSKVIELLVNEGDEIQVEDALVTLESDKASMDVPSPYAGTVVSIIVKVDQDVSEGDALIEIEAIDVPEQAADTNSGEISSTETSDTEAETVTETTPAPKDAAPANSSTSTVAVTIPDIGGDSAKVVDILVAVGEEVDIDDSLVTLESDKASMDVPSTVSGTILSIEVAVDDDVSEGTSVVTIESLSESSNSSNDSSPKSTEQPPAQKTPSKAVSQTPNTGSNQASSQTADQAETPVTNGADSHASPSIRRFARELGVDLSKVAGTGRKNRILKEDVKSFVKGALNSSTSSSPATTSSGAGIPAVPAQDFSKFGEIEITPLNKIKRLTASNLHRSWLNVPHVTHNDESNISNLEDFRKQLNAEYKAQKKDIKLSPLAFIVKAVVNALQTYPQFNSSLEPGGESLILKKYFHIGIAVETPNGLVVPVIRDADTKSVAQLAQEMSELAAKARDKKLTMNDMSGSCFTISSLGGIGGTSFTPIVNAPEVAILGVSRSKIEPIWNGEEFVPGMMLPLSLSYDHRVIDGAEAARFTRHVAAVLEDVRRLTV